MWGGLHWLDGAVLAGYLALIVAVGLWVGRRVRRTNDYFLGGRRFGVWLMLAQSFGVGTHAEMPVAVAGKVYASGYSGIWYQWRNLFITPFYWLFASMFRRFRRVTIGEVFEDRFGPGLGVVYTIFGLSYFVLNMGAMLKGGGKLVSAATTGAISPNEVVLLMTVSFLLYSLKGGLISAAYTDFIQGLFILVLSFLLIPLGLGAVGGFEGIRRTLPPEMLSMVRPGEIGLFTIFMLFVNGLIGILVQPHILASVATGRTERVGRIGMVYGNFIKRVCAIGWALVGVLAATMILQAGEAALGDPEDAFGYATAKLLFPGAVGLMFATVLAANMSTADTFSVDAAALFTQNIYQRYLTPGRSRAHYLLAGRLAAVTTAALGVVFALHVENVLEAFLFTDAITAFVGMGFFVGIPWRRVNRHGAIASLVVSSGVFFTLTYREFGGLLHWDPANFGIALVAGLAALTLVSLATPPEPAEKMRAFYERLDTPSRLDERTGEELDAREPGQDLLFVHLFDLVRERSWSSFYGRFRADLRGFAAACAVAVALHIVANGALSLP